MTQNQNYYVIVGRDGNRSVTRWAPAQIDSATARDRDLMDRRADPRSYAEVEIGRNEVLAEASPRMHAKS